MLTKQSSEIFGDFAGNVENKTTNSCTTVCCPIFSSFPFYFKKIYDVII